MARNRNNILIRGLTGSLGDQFVIRQDKAGRTIVANKPEFDENHEFSERQKANQEAFREAAAYAKRAQGETVYIDKARGTPRSPYNVAFADWYNKPQIKNLDLADWNGGAGQPIRIKAIDDVQVTRVYIVISDGNGTVFEQGNAQPDEASWWTYRTTQATNGSRRLQIAAYDKAGNKVETTWQNN
ncbi:MAG TPA: hypothetical protein VFO91_02470 [Anaerolineales bacterium]|nr:hypothetical protein [Anaerolineales bacterium]